MKSFNQLDETAQKQAIETAREYFQYFWDGDSVKEDIKNDLTQMGIEVDRINFGVCYVQADGAGFSGKVDIGRFLRYHKVTNEFRSLDYWWQQGLITAPTIKDDDFYSRIGEYGRCYAESDKAYEQLQAFEDYLNDWLSEQAGQGELYWRFRNDHSWYWSDENMLDLIENQIGDDLQFSKSGKKVQLLDNPVFSVGDSYR